MILKTYKHDGTKMWLQAHYVRVRSDGTIEVYDRNTRYLLVPKEFYEITLFTDTGQHLKNLV